MLEKSEIFDKILKNNLSLINVENIIGEPILKGSYKKLEYGDLITDIDYEQKVKYSDKFIFELQNVLKNTKNTPFKFLEMYCGLIVPYIWRFPYGKDKEGKYKECFFKFEKEEIKKWLHQLGYYAKVPEDILNDIYKRLVKRNINASVLFDIENELESYNSLKWSIEEISKGFKVIETKGKKIRIPLLKHMKNYGECIITYLYKHENDFILVDSAFVDREISSQDHFLKKFYTNDYYRMLKHMSWKLTNPYKEKYKNLMKILRVYSYIMYQIEIYTNKNSQKYLDINDHHNILSKINNFREKLNIDSQMNMNLVQLKEYIKNIRGMISYAYVKEYEDNIKENEKDEYNLMKLRTQETLERITIDDMKLRKEIGISCPFNYSNYLEYVDIYNFAKNIMIDPMLLSESILKTALSFKIPIREVLDNMNMDYSIRNVDYRLGLYKGEELLGKYLYSDRKKLQYIILNK